MSRMFTKGVGDQGSIPGRVIPKTQIIVLDAALLNIQHYKVRIKCKVEQSMERSGALPYITIEKGPLWVAPDYGCQLYLLAFTFRQIPLGKV